jgi:hypothetical protein
MLKRYLISLTILLFLSTSVLADEYQNFTIYQTAVDRQTALMLASQKALGEAINQLVTFQELQSMGAFVPSDFWQTRPLKKEPKR